MSRFHYNAEQERILDNVRKRLDELFPSKICRFNKVCKGYRKEAYTCAHEAEARDYCGLYRRHEGIIKLGEMGQMLKGTDFGDFDI